MPHICAIVAADATPWLGELHLQPTAKKGIEMTSAIALAAQAGLTAAKTMAEQNANKHLVWWASRIARAAAKGERRCDNCSILFYWQNRGSDYYIEALQKLLPHLKVRQGRTHELDGGQTITVVEW